MPVANNPGSTPNEPRRHLMEASTAAPTNTQAPPSSASGMKVRKRNGNLEAVDLNKIVRAVSRCAEGLSEVDPMRIATRTISGLYDGATTSELDRLSIQTAAALTAEEPQYSRLAGRLLSTYIDKEVQNQEIHSFSQSIQAVSYTHLTLPTICSV